MAAVLACTVSARAAPAPLPPDVRAGWSETQGAPQLPQPPEGYRTEEREGVAWVYPRQAEAEALRLQEVFTEAWDRITRDLGVEIDRRMTVRIGRNPEEMRKLAPQGQPPPQYATGVAYPPYGIILLTLTAPDTWERPSLEKVLTHELSHVALHRAVGGQPLPRWFVEGVAVHQAGEASFARFRLLWGATVGDDLIPLDQLSQHFPSQPHSVDLAYAQSADVVGFLRNSDRRSWRFRKLIRELGDGKSFGAALREAYYVSPRQLEQEWRGELHQRFQALPLVFGGGGLWVIAGGLVLIGYVRRRRRTRRKLDRMEEEEREMDRRAEEAARQQEEAVVMDSDSQEEDEDPQDRSVIYVSGDPPNGREPDVPTVQYEGRDHTLH